MMSELKEMLRFAGQVGRVGSTILLLATAAHAQGAGTLFPQPFVVEHHLIHADGDGSVFYSKSVTDYYGGSWIVSVRSDESRLVVDLARREITEIRPRQGSYWQVSFDRLAELRDRLLYADRGQPGAPQPGAPQPEEKAAAGAIPELVVTETLEAEPAAADRPPAPDKDAAALLGRPGIRHLRVTVAGAPADSPAVDVWVDSRIRLGVAARQALRRFEESVLGGVTTAQKTAAPAAWRFLAAAREQSGGALAVRTVRPTSLETGARGAFEDRATRLETVATFPLDLVAVPDGLRRVPHPLAAAAAFAEQEAERRALTGRPGQP